MAEQFITVLLRDQQDEAAYSPHIDHLLATVGSTRTGNEPLPVDTAQLQLPTVAPSVQVLEEHEDLVSHLARFAEDHYCLAIKSLPEVRERSKAADGNEVWMCVPQALMPDDVGELAAIIILVPPTVSPEVRLPKCSPQPEEGPGIYIEPDNAEGFFSALEAGHFDDHVPETVLETVEDVFNCDVDPHTSCPGILGCWT